VHAWPETVERVAAELRRSGVEAAIEELDETAALGGDVKHALGFKPERVVETVIALCDERPVAVLLLGRRRLSIEKLQRATGAQQTRIASAHEVQELTGIELGSVPPFPLPAAMRVFADKELIDAAQIWAPAGSPRYLVRCAAIDLIALARAVVLDAVDAGG
jgi:prolyl-tRNA editing enzyme YbaK/EbsC (Cys-tRNA(Pro) deacylase)